MPCQPLLAWCWPPCLTELFSGGWCQPRQGCPPVHCWGRQCLLMSTTEWVVTGWRTSGGCFTIIIIIIAFKGAVWDFWQSPHSTSKCLPTRTLKLLRHNHVQITCNTSCDYHVHCVICHLVWRDSSAMKFDRNEIAFILALFYWMKPLTDEGGEETGAPGESLCRWAS